MLNHQLETKVIGIIDRVLAKQPIEDDHIELKTTWLHEYHKVARLIAGHANAARSQPILWIIGVDEKEFSVPGANHNEFSDWWNQVQRCFSELPPEVQILNVPTHGVTVTALLFSTDRAPYVVKVENGGPITCEVPYRNANQTRSANRQQLLSILSPLAIQPTIEVLAAEFIFKRAPPSSNDSGLGYRFTADIYLAQQQGQQYFAISKRIKVIATSEPFTARLKHLNIGIGYRALDALDIVGPGQIHISGSGPLDNDVLSKRVTQPVTIRLEFPGLADSLPIIKEIELVHRAVNHAAYEVEWHYVPDEE